MSIAMTIPAPTMHTKIRSTKALLRLATAAGLCAFLARSAEACDPCALYNSSRLRGGSAGSVSLTLSEQYTDFSRGAGLPDNSLRDGEVVKGFNTTMLSIGYDLTDSFSLQDTLPLIVRRFDEFRQFRSRGEWDSGVGDMVVWGNYQFINHRREDWMVSAGIFAGVKLPTGDTGVIRDIASQESGADSLIVKHHQLASPSGGRALAFGTGSFDYILGSNLIARYERYLALSTIQYTLRTEGDFNYQFANDLIISAGGGYYILMEHDFTLAGLFTLSGEYKGRDTLDDELVRGSQLSNIFVGPGILMTFNQNIGAELGVDFRVSNEERDAPVIPESRLRATVSFRF